MRGFPLHPFGRSHKEGILGFAPIRSLTRRAPKGADWLQGSWIHSLELGMDRRHGAEVVQLREWRLGRGLTRLTDLTLRNRPGGKGQLIKSQTPIRDRDEDIRQPKLDLFPRVDDLVAEAPGGACPLCEGVTLWHGQGEEKALEVHGSSLPAGNAKSTPVGKLPSGSVHGMDLYERRQANLNVILNKMTQAELASAADISPTYVSRLLLEAGNRHRKNIGETMARKLEAAARKPEGWLDQEHGENGEALKRPGPSAQDLADLEDARLVLLPAQWEDIRARAAHARSVLRPGPNLKVLGKPPPPPDQNIEGELTKSAGKTPKRRTK